MTKNEKVLTAGKDFKTENSINIPIIAQFESFDRSNMPVILKRIDDEFIKPLYPDMNTSCRLNILLAHTLSMLSYKHIKFDELGNLKLINHYAICFLLSGGGKDRLASDLIKHIFPQFIEYVKDKAEEYFKKMMEDIVKEADKLVAEKKIKQNAKNEFIYKKQLEIRKMILEINLATPEGFSDDAKVINKAAAGSLLIKISELGLFLNLKDKTFLAFLNCLFQAYDGIVESKSTRSGKREERLENIPVNTLLYSDPTFFKTTINEYFNLLMQTGLARRAFLTFQIAVEKTIEEDPEKALAIERTAYKKAESISKDIFKIFKQIEQGSIYEMTEEAFLKVFHPYKIYLTKIYNNMSDKALIQKEIASRQLKVLKLACAFAAINHPIELKINEKDFLQAINVVNFLSKDFERFLKYKSNRRSNGRMNR